MDSEPAIGIVATYDYDHRLERDSWQLSEKIGELLEDSFLLSIVIEIGESLDSPLAETSPHYRSSSTQIGLLTCSPRAPAVLMRQLGSNRFTS